MLMINIVKETRLIQKIKFLYVFVYSSRLFNKLISKLLTFFLKYDLVLTLE